MQRPIALFLFATVLSAAANASADSIRMAQATGAPVFAKLDTNSDGKISLNEASAHDDLFVAFKKLDTNQDGDLTQTEFAAFSPGR